MDPSVVTDTKTANSFLYTGDNPIQIGVDSKTIVAQRAAVIRGKVLGQDNQPLSGVKVTILNHSEYGYTFSRTDGMFDLAINGGYMVKGGVTYRITADHLGIPITGFYALFTSMKLYGVFIIIIGMWHFLYFALYQIDIVGNQIIFTSFLSKKEIDISNIVDVSFVKRPKGPGYQLYIYDDNKCSKRPLVVFMTFYKKMIGEYSLKFSILMNI